MPGIICAAILSTALAGCATRPEIVMKQTVGPDLAQPRVAIQRGQGRLVVYSALEVADPVTAYFPTHSGYSVYDSAGKLVRRVDNRGGSFYQDPASVALPAGSYKVEGRATNAGVVLVPVIIEENKTTVVDLEGATLPQHRASGAGQWVRLPDGQVVGARAD